MHYLWNLLPSDVFIIFSLYLFVRISISLCLKLCLNPVKYVYYIFANVKSKSSSHSSHIEHILSSFLLSNLSFIFCPFIFSLLFTPSYYHNRHVVGHAPCATHLFVQHYLYWHVLHDLMATHFCTYIILYYLLQ